MSEQGVTGVSRNFTGSMDFGPQAVHPDILAMAQYGRNGERDKAIELIRNRRDDIKASLLFTAYATKSTVFRVNM